MKLSCLWPSRNKAIKKTESEMLLETAKIISRNHPHWSFGRVVKQAEKIETKRGTSAVTGVISMLVSVAVGGLIFEKLGVVFPEVPKLTRWQRFKLRLKKLAVEDECE